MAKKGHTVSDGGSGTATGSDAPTTPVSTAAQPVSASSSAQNPVTETQIDTEAAQAAAEQRGVDEIARLMESMVSGDDSGAESHGTDDGGAASSAQGSGKSRPGEAGGSPTTPSGQTATTTTEEDPLRSIPTALVDAARAVGSWDDDLIRREWRRDPELTRRRLETMKANRDEVAARFQRQEQQPSASQQRQPEPARAPAGVPSVAELTREYMADFGLDEEVAKRRAQRDHDRLSDQARAEESRRAERAREESEANLRQFLDAGQKFVRAKPEHVEFYGDPSSTTAVPQEQLQRQSQLGETAMATYLGYLALAQNTGGRVKPLSFDEAYERANRAVSFDHFTSKHRADAEAQRAQSERNSQRSIRPSATRRSEPGTKQHEVAPGDFVSEEALAATEELMSQLAR